MVAGDIGFSRIVGGMVKGFRIYFNIRNSLLNGQFNFLIVKISFLDIWNKLVRLLLLSI